MIRSGDQIARTELVTWEFRTNNARLCSVTLSGTTTSPQGLLPGRAQLAIEHLQLSVPTRKIRDDQVKWFYPSVKDRLRNDIWWILSAGLTAQWNRNRFTTFGQQTKLRHILVLTSFYNPWFLEKENNTRADRRWCHSNPVCDVPRIFLLRDNVRVICMRNSPLHQLSEVIDRCFLFSQEESGTIPPVAEKWKARSGPNQVSWIGVQATAGDCPNCASICSVIK